MNWSMIGWGAWALLCVLLYIGTGFAFLVLGTAEGAAWWFGLAWILAAGLFFAPWLIKEL